MASYNLQGNFLRFVHAIDPLTVPETEPGHAVVEAALAARQRRRGGDAKGRAHSAASRSAASSPLEEGFPAEASATGSRRSISMQPTSRGLVGRRRAKQDFSPSDELPTVPSASSSASGASVGRPRRNPSRQSAAMEASADAGVPATPKPKSKSPNRDIEDAEAVIAASSRRRGAAAAAASVSTAASSTGLSRAAGRRNDDEAEADAIVTAGRRRGAAAASASTAASSSTLAQEDGSFATISVASSRGFRAENRTPRPAAKASAASSSSSAAPAPAAAATPPTVSVVEASASPRVAEAQKVESELRANASSMRTASRSPQSDRLSDSAELPLRRRAPASAAGASREVDDGKRVQQTRLSPPRSSPDRPPSDGIRSRPLSPAGSPPRTSPERPPSRTESPQQSPRSAERPQQTESSASSTFPRGNASARQKASPRDRARGGVGDTQNSPESQFVKNVGFLSQKLGEVGETAKTTMGHLDTLLDTFREGLDKYMAASKAEYLAPADQTQLLRTGLGCILGVDVLDPLLVAFSALETVNAKIQKAVTVAKDSPSPAPPAVAAKRHSLKEYDEDDHRIPWERRWEQRRRAVRGDTRDVLKSGKVAKTRVLSKVLGIMNDEEKRRSLKMVVRDWQSRTKKKQMGAYRMLQKWLGHLSSLQSQVYFVWSFYALTNSENRRKMELEADYLMQALRDRNGWALTSLFGRAEPGQALWDKFQAFRAWRRRTRSLHSGRWCVMSCMEREGEVLLKVCFEAWMHIVELLNVVRERGNLTGALARSRATAVAALWWHRAEALVMLVFEGWRVRMLRARGRSEKCDTMRSFRNHAYLIVVCHAWKDFILQRRVQLIKQHETVHKAALQLGSETTLLSSMVLTAWAKLAKTERRKAEKIKQALTHMGVQIELLAVVVYSNWANEAKKQRRKQEWRDTALKQLLVRIGLEGDQLRTVVLVSWGDYAKQQRQKSQARDERARQVMIKFAMGGQQLVAIVWQSWQFQARAGKAATGKRERDKLAAMRSALSKISMQGSFLSQLILSSWHSLASQAKTIRRQALSGLGISDEARQSVVIRAWSCIVRNNLKKTARVQTFKLKMGVADIALRAVITKAWITLVFCTRTFRKQNSTISRLQRKMNSVYKVVEIMYNGEILHSLWLLVKVWWMLTGVQMQFDQEMVNFSRKQRQQKCAVGETIQAAMQRMNLFRFSRNCARLWRARVVRMQQVFMRANVNFNMYEADMLICVLRFWCIAGAKESSLEKHLALQEAERRHEFQHRKLLQGMQDQQLEERKEMQTKQLEERREMQEKQMEERKEQAQAISKLKAEKDRLIVTLMELGSQNASLMKNATATAEAASAWAQLLAHSEVVDIQGAPAPGSARSPGGPCASPRRGPWSPEPEASPSSPYHRGQRDMMFEPAPEPLESQHMVAMTELVKDLQRENARLHDRVLNRAHKEKGQWMGAMLSLAEDLRLDPSDDGLGSPSSRDRSSRRAASSSAAGSASMPVLNRQDVLARRHRRGPRWA